VGTPFLRHGAGVRTALCGLLLCGALAGFARPAAGGDERAPGFFFRVIQRTGGLSSPIGIANAGDGTNRLFIIEQGGRIRIWNGTQLLATPFLDITPLVLGGGEQGLLGLAFHPNYETNGFFYVNYTCRSAAPACSGGGFGQADSVLARYQVSASNPNVADPTSARVMTVIDDPFSNHNGGNLMFGPDGFLYIGLGDGGSGGDQCEYAQNLNWDFVSTGGSCTNTSRANRRTFWGKMLRLDVNQNVNTAPFYGIPATNPYTAASDPSDLIPDEIWAYGLRNPWRISFDRGTGDLFIGDVGQGSREEIDFQPAGSAGGEDYGWRIMEGSLCFNPSAGCDQSGKVLPVAEYSHSQGCSVTGGYIYRGAFYPDMQGRYFYGDFCAGILFSLYDDPVNGWTVTQVADTPYQISTFGQDEQGELYLTDYGAGTVYQICYGPAADFTVRIAGTSRASFSACQRKVIQRSLPGLSSGPVEIQNTDPLPSIASEQVIYRVNGVNTSFTEMTGLPGAQLDNVYYLPWYNNVGLDTQLRIANVSGASATVRVFVGGQEMDGSPFTLGAGASTRKSFPGVDAGPVKVESDQNIVVAERVVYKVNGVFTSFTETMGLPESQLDTTYWLPWYNNTGLDTQLRIANVSNLPATVHVSIGGAEMVGSPFTLGVGQSIRRSFPGVDDGPVKIESDQTIVAAERLIYKVNGIPTSFSEMMGLPDDQLSRTYWLPWYDNVSLDTQLRFANGSTSPATIRVYIGGAEMPGSPFTLAAGAGMRTFYTGVNNGPVRIESDQNIVTAQRVIYKVSGIPTSFTELMGLPAAQLDTTYWLPWYNNLDLDTRLRFGTP
jgi:glucose/arabinose dehydrogenase